MVVNNWYVIMDGFAGTYRVEGNMRATVATYVYFMLFWALSVVIVMNVVVAFFLETFLSRMQVDHETEGKLWLYKVFPTTPAFNQSNAQER